MNADSGNEVIHQSSTTVHSVLPAVSLKNVFAGITLPQNPGLAENNYSNAHQDSYCSESVGLTGPTSNKLKRIVKYNPYGFTPLMACNEQNQMIGVSTNKKGLYLIVFDSECEIISATTIISLVPSESSSSGSGSQVQSAGRGYFFLNNKNQTVVNAASNTLACYDTSNLSKKDSVYSLEPLWTSKDLVEIVAPNQQNALYSAMPLWRSDGKTNFYWFTLSGVYDAENNKLISNAYVAVVEIVPVDGETTAQTMVHGFLELENQWINNTLAVDQKGVYLVTNGVGATPDKAFGSLLCFNYTESSGSGNVYLTWSSPYINSGYLKPGQLNIGSGTTPTLFQDESDKGYVTITDNAYPRMHVDIYNRDTGGIVCEVPLFPKMRCCNEASIIGVNGRVVVPNNFGHTYVPGQSQFVANEPGFNLVKLTNGSPPCDVVWANKHERPLGMSMLARNSGIIFAFIGDWNVADSATNGALYSVCAFDSWDGRKIWSVPVGQGYKYCHDYGGTYFNRTGTQIFVGTQEYLVSVQNAE